MSARYGQTIGHFHGFFQLLTWTWKVRPRHWKVSLRTADAFPVVASLTIFGGREATTGNASAVRWLLESSP